jgi:hypothetical protein
MPHQLLPSAAVPAALPLSVRPKIISAASEPPHGDDWLHEVKHDGHRLIAIVARPGSTKLPQQEQWKALMTLPVEPHVFHTPTIIDAVDMQL